MATDNLCIGTGAGRDIGNASFCVIIGDDIYGEPNVDNQMHFGNVVFCDGMAYAYLQLYDYLMDFSNKYSSPLVKEKLNQLRLQCEEQLRDNPQAKDIFEENKVAWCGHTTHAGVRKIMNLQ